MFSLKRCALLTRFLWKSGTATSALGGGGLIAEKKGKSGKKGFSLFKRGEGANKQRSKLKNILLYLFSFALTSFYMYVMASELTKITMAMGRPEIFHVVFLVGQLLLMTMTGIFTTVSIFYLSDDRERVLALPFTMGEVVGARYMLLVLYQAIMPLMMGLPAWTTFGVISGQPAIYYVKMVTMLLSVTFAPVAIYAIISMILMRFTPMAKNKDRFIMIFNIVVLFVFVFIFFTSSRMQNSNIMTDPGSLERLTSQSGAIGRISKLIPTTQFWVNFMSLSSTEAIKNLLIALGISVLLSALAVVVAHYFYGYAITSVGQSSAKKRALKAGEWQRAIRPSSQFSALFRTEIQGVFRSPVFLMNNVMQNFIMIFIVGVTAYFAMKQQGALPSLDMMREQIHGSLFNFEPGEEGMMYAVYTIIGLAISLYLFFAQGSAYLNASALSREGSQIYWMKMMPASIEKQLGAKTLLSVILSVGLLFILVVIAGILFQLPLLFVVYILLVLVLAAYGGNLLALWVDALSPNLEWENEQQVVKNSKNAILSLVVSWLVAATFGGLIYLIAEYQIEGKYLPFALLGLLSFIVALFYVLSHRRVKKTLAKIENYQ